MGKFRQGLTELSVRDTIMVGYYSLTFLLQSFFSSKTCSIIISKRRLADFNYIGR